jgi:predicted GNAT superfamily acetyltransferase
MPRSPDSLAGCSSFLPSSRFLLYHIPVNLVAMTATSATNLIIKPLHSATEPLLALNNAHAVQLSMLTLTELEQLIRASFHSAAINEADALLIAFDQSSHYDNENLRWFHAYFEKKYPAESNEPSKNDRKFVYVDRVVTSPAARGRGYARALYRDLFQRAKTAGHTRIVCEVNLDPPNPISDAFHATLGFSEIGRAIIRNGAKTVRYLLRPLGQNSHYEDLVTRNAMTYYRSS